MEITVDIGIHVSAFLFLDQCSGFQPVLISDSNDLVCNCVTSRKYIIKDDINETEIAGDGTIKKGNAIINMKIIPRTM